MNFGYFAKYQLHTENLLKNKEGVKQSVNDLKKVEKVKR